MNFLLFFLTDFLDVYRLCFFPLSILWISTLSFVCYFLLLDGVFILLLFGSLVL